MFLQRCFIKIFETFLKVFCDSFNQKKMAAAELDNL